MIDEAQSRIYSMSSDHETLSTGSDHHHQMASSTLASASESRLTSRRLCLRRCLTALNITLEQLEIMLEQPSHFFAPLALNRKREEFVKLHMNGTNNSRRFIHVYLWWARLLGPNYPISDDMLQGRVWKHLRCTCGEGILDTRGHRKPADPRRVCIAPTHYTLAPGADLLGIVMEDADNLCREVSGDNMQAMAFLGSLSQLISEHPTLDALVDFIRRTCPPFSFASVRAPQPSPPRPRAHKLAAAAAAVDDDSSEHSHEHTAARDPARHTEPATGAEALLMAADFLSSRDHAERAGSAGSTRSPSRTKRALSADDRDEDFKPPRSTLPRPHRQPLRTLAGAPQHSPQAIGARSEWFGSPPRSPPTTLVPAGPGAARSRAGKDAPAATVHAARRVDGPDGASDSDEEQHLEIAEEVTTMTKQLSVEDSSVQAGPSTAPPTPGTTPAPYTQPLTLLAPQPTTPKVFTTTTTTTATMTSSPAPSPAPSPVPVRTRPAAGGAQDAKRAALGLPAPLVPYAVPYAVRGLDAQVEPTARTHTNAQAGQFAGAHSRQGPLFVAAADDTLATPRVVYIYSPVLDERGELRGHNLVPVPVVGFDALPQAQLVRGAIQHPARTT